MSFVGKTAKDIKHTLWLNHSHPDIKILEEIFDKFIISKDFYIYDLKAGLQNLFDVVNWDEEKVIEFQDENDYLFSHNQVKLFFYYMKKLNIKYRYFFEEKEFLYDLFKSCDDTNILMANQMMKSLLEK